MKNTDELPQLLKNKAKVLLENLITTRKALTSFHWRQFLPVKSWRPRLPFEKYQEFIISQGEMSRDLQRECHSASLKLEHADKAFVLTLKEYCFALEKAYKSLEGVRLNREWRDEQDPQFTLKSFKKAIVAHQDDVDKLYLEARKLNDIWLKR